VEAPPSRYGYEPALDGVRALAVLAVICYHDAYIWAKGGFLGVDAFFVLSGFLITTLLVLEYWRAQGIEVVAFWGRRIRRLLPALLLVLVFVAIYGWIFLPAYELDRLRWDGIAGLFYFANWRFIATGASYFDLIASPSPVRPLWSLAIEEQFYLVWPLVTFACLRLARGRLRVLAGVCVVGTAASVWLMQALWTEGDPSRAYFGTDARAHTILVGCLLALLLLVWRPRARFSRLTVQIAGVLGALGVLWAWNRIWDVSHGYYGLGSLLYAVAVAAVIAAAVQPERGPLRVFLGWRPLVWVGTISYGLYLWHWPINLWLVEARAGFGGSALNGLRLVVTFAAATASYYLVERPIRLRRWPAPNQRWLVAPAGILLVGLTLFVSTAGAKPPPTFLGVPATACLPPSRSELAAARRAYRRDPMQPRSGPRFELAVIGDSTACSLQPGLQAAGPSQRMRVRDATVIGCGVVSGELSGDPGVIPVGTDQCPAIVADELRRVRASDPDVVLWISGWEKDDLKVGDRVVEAGTREHDRLVLRRMGRELRRLTRDGAKVVLVTVPPHTVADVFGNLVETPERENRRFEDFNALLLRFVAAHPEVTLVDLSAKVCPGGIPCPRELDGFAPRGMDGSHFTPRGAVWATEFLAPTLAAAGEAAVAERQGT